MEDSEDAKTELAKMQKDENRCSKTVVKLNKKKKFRKTNKCKPATQRKL